MQDWPEPFAYLSPEVTNLGGTIIIGGQRNRPLAHGMRCRHTITLTLSLLIASTLPVDIEMRPVRIQTAANDNNDEG